jgi:hypothetical protein
MYEQGHLEGQFIRVSPDQFNARPVIVVGNIEADTGLWRVFSFFMLPGSHPGSEAKSED